MRTVALVAVRGTSPRKCARVCEQEAALVDSEIESQAIEQPRACYRSWTKGASAALVLCGTIAFIVHPGGSSQSSASIAARDEKMQIIAEPGRDKCANTTENCWSKGCCNVEGFNCFVTTADGNANCMKECKAPMKCTQPPTIMAPRLQEVEKAPATALYCFAVMATHTGSPTPSKNHELELLQYAHTNHLSLFQCDQTGLFSDAPVELAEGVKFTQLFDVDKDWHFAKRKHVGTWVNTGLFTQAWKAIKAEGRYTAADWVVKVDADSVFLPARLEAMLTSRLEVAEGTYITNCQYVDYGFFGNLEVFSTQAFSTLVDHVDECKADTETINWKVGIKDGKYGPMGEDLLAQTCMSKWGVKKVTAFDMSQDGLCEAKRDKGQKKNKLWKPHCEYTYAVSYHPFKKPDEWKKCFGETISKYPQPLR